MIDVDHSLQLEKGLSGEGGIESYTYQEGHTDNCDV